MNFKNSSFFLLTITLFLSLFFPLNKSQANPGHNQSSPHSGHEMKDINNTMEDMKSMDEIEGDHNHSHKALDISDNSDIPTLAINASPDAIKGWNLEIKTTNFTFTPENLNQASIPNQGHAHLYINGKKVTRIYGNWYYISELPKGDNKIKVTLNTDNHENLVYQGQIISDRIIIKNK